MKDFQDKVAVVTGAASGIGRALAGKSAQEGMKVVLADVEESALKQAEEELKASGAQVVAVRTDVSDSGYGSVCNITEPCQVLSQLCYISKQQGLYPEVPCTINIDVSIIKKDRFLRRNVEQL